jgi:predicted DNA-binding transcriptional regulator YafY
MPEKASRLLKIYSRLKTSVQTIDTIKKWAKDNDINVSDRQLYRDLKEIENLVLQDGETLLVKEGEKNRKTWKIEFDKSRKEKLSGEVINTFFLLKNFAPLNITTAKAESINYIEALFYNQNSKSDFERNTNQIQITNSHFYDVPYSKQFHSVLDKCIWSVQNKRKVILKTTDFDHTGLAVSLVLPHVILPIQILYHRGCIHLCSLLEQSQELIILAIEQITDFALTNDMFDNTELVENFTNQFKNRFGITENIDNNIYDIIIEFSELTGSFVSNHFWHTSQKFNQTANGNWIMALKCGINRELVGWIFQWMSNVKVLQPQILKTLVYAKIISMQELYQNDNSPSSNNVFRPQ